MQDGQHRRPEFLTESDEPVYRVRCGVHGFIRYSHNERQIIDHRHFQRLRFIRQLGLTEYLYPGATHTRFEHSLGVMEVATRMFDSLAEKHGVPMEEAIQEVAFFADRPLAKARQVLRLAALLHDAGHAAFSHAAEEVVHRDGHEELSRKMLREMDLGLTIDRIFGHGFAAQAANMLDPVIDTPQLAVIRQLLSGEVDADRADYLLRDSLHCGVSYGRFDLARLIECVAVVPTDEGGLELAIHRDGLQVFEAHILARYQMNTQIYYHRVRRIYDYYLIEYHKLLNPKHFSTSERILALHDGRIMNKIERDASNPKSPGYQWARRIWNRDHHRRVHETRVGANAGDVRNALDVEVGLRRSFKDVEFILDRPRKSISIHKLLTRSTKREYDQDAVRLPLIGHKRREAYAGYESDILSTIPTTFDFVRIYADVAGRPPEVREMIEKKAQELDGKGM